MAWDIEQATQALAADIESKATSMEDAIRKHLTNARDELQKEARLVFTKVSRFRALIDLLVHPATKVAHTSDGKVVVTNPDMPIGVVENHDFKPLKVEGQAELPLPANDGKPTEPTPPAAA